MPQDSESKQVILETSGQTATIRIDRPHVRNAIDLATADAIAAAIDQVESRDDLSAAILTGSAGMFSAGMDLKAFAATGERPVNAARGLFGVVDLPPAKPLIAAVEGRCLGGGFELALACDLIIAADDAVFGLPEVRRGLLAAGGGLVRLPRRIPRNVAMELAITGNSLDAARARELGLVAKVVPGGTALAAAVELAARISLGAPLAVRASKRVLAMTEGLSEQEAFIAQREAVSTVRASEDAREGTRAFLEKRAPEWSGR